VAGVYDFMARGRNFHLEFMMETNTICLFYKTRQSPSTMKEDISGAFLPPEFTPGQIHVPRKQYRPIVQVGGINPGNF